jgi:hypothetical protein
MFKRRDLVLCVASSCATLVLAAGLRSQTQVLSSRIIEWTTIEPRTVLFLASNQLHAVRNVGTTNVTYHVMSWNSPGTMTGR